MSSSEKMPTSVELISREPDWLRDSLLRRGHDNLGSVVEDEIVRIVADPFAREVPLSQALDQVTLIEDSVINSLRGFGPALAVNAARHAVSEQSKSSIRTPSE